MTLRQSHRNPLDDTVAPGCPDEIPEQYMPLVEARSVLFSHRFGRLLDGEPDNSSNTEEEVFAKLARLGREVLSMEAELHECVLSAKLDVFVAVTGSSRIRRVPATDWTHGILAMRPFARRTFFAPTASTLSDKNGRTMMFRCRDFYGWLAAPQGDPLSMRSRALRSRASIQSRAPLGRRPKYDWLAIEGQIYELFDRFGLPDPGRARQEWKTQADVVRRILEWCEQTFGAAPSESLMKEHIQRVSSRFIADRRRSA